MLPIRLQFLGAAAADAAALPRCRRNKWLALGAAALVLGVPAAVPLAIIPFVGAVVAGMLVALVANGLTVAIIVVVVVTIVQQIEGDLLYPLVVARTIELHPLVVLVAITTGAVLAGIIGAIIAIPVVAVVSQALTFSRERRTGNSPSGDGIEEAG